MHGGAAGRSGRMGMRSMTRDRAILEHRVARGTFRRIVRFAQAYRKILMVFLGAVVIDAAVTSVAPLLLRAIIDTAIPQRRLGLVVELATLTAVLALADAGLSLIERRISANIGEGIIYDLRSRVFDHIQSMPIAFFSRTQTGALVSRLNNDVIGAQQAFTDLLSNVVGNVVLVGITLTTMLILSWPITLVALVLLPAFLLPARRMGRRIGTLFQRGMELNAEMNSFMTERFNVAGAMLAKLYGRPHDESARFSNAARGVRDIGIRQAVYQRFFLISLSLTAAIATAFAYGFGGVAVIHGTMALGTVVAITAYLARLYGPLTQLSNVHVDYMSAVVSFERLFEVLDLEPLVREAETTHEVEPGPVSVEFRHVNFAYPRADEVSLASLESVAKLEETPSSGLLEDISFTIEPGTMTALVGPSGAGKTTISMLLARLYDVNAGAVLLNGRDVRELSFASLFQTVGVVTQDAHLFHDTLRGNLLLARPDATEADMVQALRDAQLAGLLDSLPLGLDTVVGERGYRLSGGEKQRVALARLLLKAPRVVVLDEATAHLDAESEAAVQRALEETRRDRTSLVIAHRLSTIRNAAQILVVDQGRIVERGTHETLHAANGLYRLLYETQFAGQEG